MKKYFIHSSTVVALLALTACSTPSSNTDSSTRSSADASSEQSSETSSLVSSVFETKNVTYTGTVRPAGISVYQEGTHRLVFENSKFILLEADAVDLNGYVGEKAKVFGSLRPTEEEGAMIMRVEKISLIDTDTSFSSSSHSSEESTSDSSEHSTVDDSINGDLGLLGNSSSTEVSIATNSVIPELPEIISQRSESSIEKFSSTASSDKKDFDETSQKTTPSPLEDIIASMAADNYAPERWTQEYCTTHIGFCIPLHKNWYFKSFGTTTNDLWHVELSNVEIDSLGEGPILVKLLSGTVGSKKSIDGQVRVQGSTVIGFKEWDDSRHFEITADARLQEPVEYIVKNLRRTE